MKKRIVVLGAGISGLAAAWFLRKRYGNSVDITVVERTARTGGWIRTIEQDGFLFELGPRSCRTGGSGAETMQLIKDLGLQDDVIAASPSAKERYILHKQHLQKAPSGLLSLVLSPMTRPVAWRLLNEWRVPVAATDDESIDSFVRRRLGDQAANLLVDSLVSGIFAGDPTKLSMRCCFPSLYEMERRSGSLTKAMYKGIFKPRAKGPRIISLKGGMETLTQTLTQQLEANILLNTSVHRLEVKEDGVSVGLANGQCIQADHVYSALPANELARLLGKQSELPYASVAVVNFGFRHKVLPKDGFGYLIPSQEKEKVLGVVWDSCVFPQQNRHPEETRLTVMIGGSRMHNFEQYDDKAFANIAQDALLRHLGIDQQPDAVHVGIAYKAIPQYPVGYKDQPIPTCPHLTALGSSFDGVSIGDCIASARQRTSEEARSQNQN